MMQLQIYMIFFPKTICEKRRRKPTAGPSQDGYARRAYSNGPFLFSRAIFFFRLSAGFCTLPQVPGFLLIFHVFYFYAFLSICQFFPREWPFPCTNISIILFHFICFGNNLPCRFTEAKQYFYVQLPIFATGAIATRYSISHSRYSSRFLLSHYNYYNVLSCTPNIRDHSPFFL